MHKIEAGQPLETFYQDDVITNGKETYALLWASKPARNLREKTEIADQFRGEVLNLNRSEQEADDHRAHELAHITALEKPAQLMIGRDEEGTLFYLSRYLETQTLDEAIRVGKAPKKPSKADKKRIKELKRRKKEHDRKRTFVPW